MGSTSTEEVSALGHQLCDPSISKRDTSLGSRVGQRQIKSNAWAAVKVAHCGSWVLLHACLAGWYADDMYIVYSVVRRAETSL